MFAALAAVVGMPAAAAGEPAGMLRIAHLSPDTPAVDVTLARLASGARGPQTTTGPVVAAGLRYGTVGAYRNVAPGSYALSVRKAGADARTAPALSARVEVPAGGVRTIALTGRFADLAVQALTDDLSPPPPHSARVRVLAAAAGAPTVEVALTTAGPPSPSVLADALPFGGAGTPTVVPAGASTVHIGGGSGSPTDLPIDLTGGSVVSVVVLDRPDGGLALRVVVDAAGPSIAPSGPVEAGGGGTAGPPLALLAVGLPLTAALAGAAARNRRRLLLPLAAALLVLPMPAASAATRVVPAPAPAPTLEVQPGSAAAAPVRVVVPSVGVDTALGGIGLDRSGALIPPEDPGTAGWFRTGPAPGDRGPAVLTGHVDSAAGPGAFFRIGRAAVGDPVLVRRADGTTVRFLVTRVARYAKGGFPTAEVYGPTPGAELRLITCGGRFDAAKRSYVDDVVVFARMSAY